MDLDHVRQHAVATAGVAHGLIVLLLQLLQMNLVIQQLGAGSSVAELPRKPAPVKPNSALMAASALPPDSPLCPIR